MKVTYEQKIENICILGISFKPNVPDTRESPALEIFQRLVSNKSVNVFGIDPLVDRAEVPNLNLISINDVNLDNTIVIKLVDHDIFKSELYQNIPVLSFV